MPDSPIPRGSSTAPLRPRAEEVRSRLLGSALRSPHDFIREVSVEADWRFWVESQTASRPESIDLSVVWEGPGGPLVAFASMLPWDSEFFGIRTARLDALVHLDSPGYAIRQDLVPAIRDITDHVAKFGVEYFFAVVDARDAAVCRSLAECGFGLIESRLTHFRHLGDFAPPERASVKIATEQDVATLQAAAVRMSNSYDRFHADPRLPLDLVDRLMSRWVTASVLEGFADATVIPAEGPADAFCTVKYHRDRWAPMGIRISQTVFGAVSTERRGWYRKLISEIHCMFRDAGVECAYLVTQPSNRAVIRTWERLGFQFGRNELVFRKWLGQDTRR